MIADSSSIATTKERGKRKKKKNEKTTTLGDSTLRFQDLYDHAHFGNSNTALKIKGPCLRYMYHPRNRELGLSLSVLTSNSSQK